MIPQKTITASKFGGTTKGTEISSTTVSAPHFLEFFCAWPLGHVHFGVKWWFGQISYLFWLNLDSYWFPRIYRYILNPNNEVVSIDASFPTNINLCYVKVPPIWRSFSILMPGQVVGIIGSFLPFIVPTVNCWFSLPELIVVLSASTSPKE